jgi:hypothetical protein
MSQTSTSSTASSHSDYHARLEAVLARIAARNVATEKRKADHAQRLKEIEDERRKKYPDAPILTFEEMTEVALRSGVLWTTPESMASLLKLHNECLAPPPYIDAVSDDEGNDNVDVASFPSDCEDTVVEQ